MVYRTYVFVFINIKSITVKPFFRVGKAAINNNYRGNIVHTVLYLYLIANTRKYYYKTYYVTIACLVRVVKLSMKRRHLKQNQS